MSSRRRFTGSGGLRKDRGAVPVDRLPGQGGSDADAEGEDLPLSNLPGHPSLAQARQLLADARADLQFNVYPTDTKQVVRKMLDFAEELRGFLVALGGESQYSRFRDDSPLNRPTRQLRRFDAITNYVNFTKPQQTCE